MGISNNAVKAESPDEVVAFLNQRPYLDFELIAEMADAGFQFVGTTMGLTRSDLKNWPELATSDKKQIKNWLNQGMSLVSVANRGHAFSLDFDNLKACLAKGFKLEWIDDYFIADSPSGGIHAHGLADDVTDSLPGIITVYEVKDNASTPKIFEFKLHHQSVAAPTAPRIGQRKKADGIYKPRKWHGTPRKGVDPEFLVWLESVTTIRKQFKSGTPNQTDFHPDFEMIDFLENEDCVEQASGYVNGVWMVVVKECPHCGREADKSTIAHGVTKFIFGGNSYGFVCHPCGVNTKEEHETLMAKENVSYEPWNWLMYAKDDPEYEMKMLGEKLAIDDVTNEPDPPAPIVVEDDEPEPEPTCVSTDAANLKYPELRFPYHILKVAILTALVNMHKLIEQDDWDFAVAFMNWQHEIRMAFSPGRAKRTTQGEFNDTIVRELEKRTAKMKLDPVETKTQKIAGRGDMKRCFFRWKGLANDGKWHLKGLDIKRTIQSLVDGGTLVYLVTGDPDVPKTLETDDSWVRLVRGSGLGKEVKNGTESSSEA